MNGTKNDSCEGEEELAHSNRFHLKLCEPSLEKLSTELDDFEKNSGVRLTKQQLIELAIKKKIEKEKLPSSPPPPRKSLHLRLDKDLSKEVRKRVSYTKRVLGKPYSHAQWIYEAIQEYLAK